MPNWVFNSLVVSGDKSELDKMVAQLNKPFVKHFPEMKYNKETEKWENLPDVQIYDNPIFAFWNIVKPTDLEAYYGEDVYKGNANIKKDDDGKFDGESFMQEFVRSMKEDQDWYHWNCRNWGTKWDVAVDNKSEYPNTIKTVNDDGSVMYHFQTAWSPVGEVLMKLSEMYPTLEFDYEYEEEQGWGGSCTFLGGEDIACDEYNSPESHADYKERDKECQCEWDDTPEYWYQDCPVDTTKFKWDTELGEWQELSDLSDKLVSTTNLQGE
jgi:hypothetical protein